MSPKKKTGVENPGRDPATGRLTKGNTLGFRPGQSGNPGGLSAEVAEARRVLGKEGSREAALFLVRVVAGETFAMSIDGQDITMPADIDQRLRAADIILGYTMPKPQQEVAVSTVERSALDDMPLDALLAVKKVFDDVKSKPRA